MARIEAGAEEQKKKFRLHAKNVFITFPRTPAACSKTALAAHLQLLQPKPAYYCVAEERHEDGTPHLHALIGYDTRVNLKRVEHYDFMGRHPNIGACRNPRASWKYLHKEDPAPIASPGAGRHFLGGRGDDPDAVLQRQRERRKFIDLAREGKTEEAREEFINRHPRDYVVARERIEATFAALAPKKQRAVLEGFQAPEGFSWSQEKALHIWGEPNTGKTEWAKHLAHGDYLFVTHLDDLKRFKGEGTIIFDDMCFTTYSREFCIALCDTANDRSIHCRYHPATIPAGTKRIFTSNPSSIWPQDDHGALGRRIQQLEIRAPLYGHRPQDEENQETAQEQDPNEGSEPRSTAARLVREKAFEKLMEAAEKDDDFLIDFIPDSPVFDMSSC